MARRFTQVALGVTDGPLRGSTVSPSSKKMPEYLARGWRHRSWSVTLKYRGRRFTTLCHTGHGWDRPPLPCPEVLGGLLDDAMGVENAQDFEDWANEFGFRYDDDAPKERRQVLAVYRAVERQTEGVKRLLGDDYDRISSMGQGELKDWCRGQQFLP